MTRLRRRTVNWLLAALLLACNTLHALALDPGKTIARYIHDSWGAERGFPGGAVYAIGQSTDGYLWIGTERGLVRFDGLNFILMQKPLPSAPPIGAVRSLVSDAEGNLWVRVDGPHLLRYRNGKFEDAYMHFGLQDLTFTTLVNDEHGGIFLIGLGNHIMRYAHGSFTNLAAKGMPGTVISIADTPDGAILMGTRDAGLLEFSRGQLSPICRELANTSINTLLQADTNSIWAGTDAGFRLCTRHGGPSKAAHALSASQILATHRDRDGNIWLGSSRGLIRTTLDGVSRAGVAGQEVRALFEDSEGDLWFGGRQRLERLRDGIFTSYSSHDLLPSDKNGPIYVDREQRLWFAPLRGGLYWLKDDHVEHVSLAGLDHDVVYSISGGDGEIWVARQRGGLTRLTGAGTSMRAASFTQADGLPQNSVYSVHRNRDGTVWAGTVSGGVSRISHGVISNYSRSTGLSSDAINSIIEGRDGTTWIATANGLDGFFDGKWTHPFASHELAPITIRSLYEDSRNLLWIAGSNGIGVLESGHVRWLHTLPDPLREQVCGMAEDGQGSLWIATSDHVVRVNRDHLLSGSIADSELQSFGLMDGLAGAEGVRRDRSVTRAPDGRIWLSLSGGLDMVNPRFADGQAVPGRVRIESVLADGTPLDRAAAPKLAAGRRSLTFNYAGTSLAVLDRVRFRYRLDGADADWSSIVTSRQVVYSHLGTGSYRFRVIASNSQGIWNGPETIVPFVIEPAFWQKGWFQGLSVIAALSVIFSAHRLRMYSVRRQLSMRFQERLIERTKIAQELHDTLLQGMLSASMQLDVVEDQLPDSSPAKPPLRRILLLMSQVNDEGRNALRGLRRPETGSLDLEVAFSRMRYELAMDEKIQYRVVSQGTPRQVSALVRDEAYRIGREAVINSVIHSHPTVIELEVEYGARLFRIIVRDDGCGIDTEVLYAGREGHWGLVGMRERAENIRGTLQLRSRSGAGTEVELTVPADIAFEAEPAGNAPGWLPWRRRHNFKTASSVERRRDPS